MITREHNGHAFTFREDGWFNMTQAAKAFGRDIYEFLRLPSTKEYITALSSSGIFTGQGFVETVPGNRYIPNRGTWGHPKLAVFFARWLDVRFAVWCDSVIEDILTKKAEDRDRSTKSNRWRLPLWMPLVMGLDASGHA